MDRLSPLDAAVSAGRWIVSQADVGDDAPSWGRQREGGIDHGLYGGTAGVLLFLRRLADVTGEPWAAVAAGAATAELATVAEAPANVTSGGLYSGLGGIAFALGQDASSVPAAHHLVDELVARDVTADDCTDIISGTAGVGLSLLWAATALSRDDVIETAIAAGDHLLGVGEPAEPERDGRRWRYRATVDFDMPNFSHGTAGVAFFLARLAATTGEDRFLSAAEAGGRHLVAIADPVGGGSLIHHHTPGGESLHYLGWCHGPPGTARLFQQLHELTEDSDWADARDALVDGLLSQPVPEGRTEGFWNNVGRCCGDAGVAEFAQDLVELDADRDGRLEDLARRCTEHILSRAVGSEEGDGLCWPHSEHRARPEQVEATTGLMQGAAGIGLWLLRAQTGPGTAPPLRLPDDLAVSGGER